MAIGYKMRPSTRKCDKNKVFKKNLKKITFAPFDPGTPGSNGALTFWP